MKKLLILLCLLLLLGSCVPTRNFYKRKYPRENARSYREKRGLMILQNIYLGRNREFNSKANIKRRTHKLRRK